LKAAAGALILAAALSVTSPLADTTPVAPPIATTSAKMSPPPAAGTSPAPAAASTAAIRPGFTAAPVSVTSAAVLMARAFRPKPQTCEIDAPGVMPVLAPAPANQPSCMLNPFTDTKLWAYCPAFPASPVIPLGTSGKAVSLKRQTAFIAGDQIEGIQSGVSLVSGSVQLDDGDRRLTSDKMTYDSNSGIVVVNHNVNYFSPRMMLNSPSGVYNTVDGTGTFQDTNYLIPKRNGRGTAGVFNVLDSDRDQLYNTTYTTCPPGHDDWMLSSPDMYLDTVTNTGEGHDMTIDFMGVPVFWSPYLNFPISSDRKSGFINGAFSFDVVDGFEFSAPYYFNLANNYDATLFPRIISKRGVQTGGEFRWLDEVDQGEIYADYLPHDQIADRERSQLYINDTAKFNEFNTLSTLYQWASDDNYFQDLGTDLDVQSTTLLERHILYTYDDEMDWMFLSQLEDFQTIAPGVPPQRFTYRRLPQLLLNWSNNEDVTGPQYNFYAETVRFQRDLRVGAWRTDIKPSVSLPISDAAGYFTPTLAWRLTDYDMTGTSYMLPGGNPILIGDRHLSRSLPIFSIDTGVYFDRNGGDYTESLEPRLYYLRVPYRNQDEIPDFDATQPQFSYLQLFSDNRFIGGDRQGDANQLSYALTTRVLNSLTGVQLFQIDVGQARYFSDQRVQLNPGNTPTNASLYSDVVGDMLVNINDVWNASYNQLWNPVTRETDLASVLLQYHPGYHEIVNVGYEFLRPNVKQPTISFAWPLMGPWSVIGGWNYDFISHETLEQIWGFEYDTCCWNFQLAHRRFMQPNKTFDNIFFFSIELKGLGTVGRHLEDLLQRDILGYSDNEFSDPLTPEQQPSPP
jgi:LPS-assembly protein